MSFAAGSRDAAPFGRDSLELGSLASSSAREEVDSRASSPSGPPSSRKLSIDDDDPLKSTNAIDGPSANRRSYSISSTFDFARPLFPLSASGHSYTAIGDPDRSVVDLSLTEGGGSLERQKSLTFLNGLSLVVGLIIGTGIFSSPSQVNINAGSPGASLIVWLVAGLLAWTGAASYAELGGAIPLNGGAQVYLAKTYGEIMGFLFSWFSVCVLKPGSAAVISIIFSEYMVRAVIGADAVETTPWINKGVAIAGLTLVSFLNSISTKIAARSADIFMFFKFVALLGITTLGVFVAISGFSWDNDATTEWKTRGWFEGTSTDLSRLAVALYAGLWAFDGWDNTNYVVGEFINPSRDLPRVIHTALPLVILGYVLVNLSYFFVLPWAVTSTSFAIAVAFGRQVLGPIGALLLALTVAGSGFGSLNATVFTSSRLFYAAANEGYLPRLIGTIGLGNSRGFRIRSSAGSGKDVGVVKRILSRLCADRGTQSLFLTPIYSLLLNYVVTSIYILMGTFEALITFYGLAAYLFYFMTVLGLIILRVREPHLERPYRCWITTPVVFCCVSLFLLSRSLVAQPWTCGAVGVFLVVGLVVFFFTGGKRTRERIKQRVQNSNGPRWQFWKRWAWR